MHIFLMEQDGTGKTTAAKIFARAINCFNPIDGEPCNKCDNCISILEGNTTDVIEMDAASNNSVENIRSIRQEVTYATTSLKYRVYIIDEAHMLSTSAFNALLKTLEEPPQNVIFILATTEENKIIPTILSRCVRFEFKKLSQENISTRVKEILKKDKIEYEEKAVEYISKTADGGMRDGLTILERCIDIEDKKLTYEKVLELIGDIDKDMLEDIAVAILAYNTMEVNNILQKILESGKNLRNVLNNMLNIFVELLVYKTSQNGEVSKSLKESMNMVSTTRIGYIIDKLAMLDDLLRQALNQNIIFKAVILELSIGNVEKNPKDIIEKIKNLELKIEKLEATMNKENIARDNKIEAAKEGQKIKKEKPTDKKENKNIKEFKDIDKISKAAADKDNLKLYSALADVKGFLEEDRIIFETKNSFAYGILRKQQSEEELKQILQEITGEEQNIQIKLITEAEKEENEFENCITNSGIPFEVID